MSGSKEERPGLKNALSHLREGDTLVVWKLDRLGRAVKSLIELVKDFSEKNIHFASLQESIDTSSSTGKFTFHLFCSLAQLERDRIIERTHAGLKAARAKGRVGGRPPALDDKEIKRLKILYKESKVSIGEICRMFSISRPTLYHYIKS